jgi:hypothetical protein
MENNTPILAKHKFRIPIETEEDLRAYVKLAWGVTIPDTKVCPHHTTPWRAFSDAYFGRSPVSIWKGSRGFGGKSFLLAVLGATESSTLKAGISILGGSGAQSLRVQEHMTSLWNYENAPKSLISSMTSEKMKLKWGNTVVALMASQTSVRGPHPQRLRLDEIDEMDLSILDASLGQPMTGSSGIQTQTVMSSTHQYAAGTMTEILKRANEKGWPVYEWCYKETSNPVDGWLQPSEIERKRQEITDVMWRTEYDLQAPNPGSRAIMTEAVESAFDNSLGVFEGGLHEYIEIEPPMGKCTKCLNEQPWDFTVIDNDESIHRICGVCQERDTISRIPYITGADWAKKVDFTIIPTFRIDKLPIVCVAWERSGRTEWPYMTDLLVKRVKRFGGKAAHDGTGIGDVVASMLPPSFESVIMAGATRSKMLTDYIAEIENHRIKYPMIKYAYTEHLNASVEDVFGGGQNSHLPDSISGGSLAYTQFGRQPVRLYVAKDRGRK